MKQKKNFLLFVVILAVTVIAGGFILPQPGVSILNQVATPNLFFNNFLFWRLGLDLVGGSSLIYEIDLTGFEPDEHESVVAGLRDVIERRVNLYGVTEPRISVIQKGGYYRLMVELAGVRDLDEAVRQIGETPVLNFMINCGFLEPENEGQIEGQEQIEGQGQVEDQGQIESEEQIEGQGQEEAVFQCQPTPLTGRHIDRAVLGSDEFGRMIVSFELKDEGPQLFEEITGQNIGRPLCIFMDNNFIFPDDPAGSCPVINEKITGGRAQISGAGITPEVAIQLVERFNAGALAAPITLINQRTVNATAAQDSLQKIILAGIVGAFLIMLFMIVNYRKWGILSSLVLLIYIILTLAIFKLIPGFTMSLAGIAGFVLTIGMAVDANILVFERTKEEIKKGLATREAFEQGFVHTWSSIRDSNVATIITAVILYYLTSSFVRGFALTLMIGVIISMFSAMVITKTMVRALIKK